MMPEYTSLIVESNDVIAQQMTRLLREFHCDVHRVKTASEAESAFIRIHPDITFIDTKLEDCDGVTLLRKIKQSDPANYVVMLSEDNDSELVKSAITNGSLGFILCPLSKEKLVINFRRFRWLFSRKKKPMMADQPITLEWEEARAD